jgi:hypothetical protein
MAGRRDAARPFAWYWRLIASYASHRVALLKNHAMHEYKLISRLLRFNM